MIIKIKGEGVSATPTAMGWPHANHTSPGTRELVFLGYFDFLVEVGFYLVKAVNDDLLSFL